MLFTKGSKFVNIEMERRSVAYFGLSVIGGLVISTTRKFLQKSKSSLLFSTKISTSEPMIRKKSQIYTRTGDNGSSSLYNGERRPKTDLVFEALGHQDELNACIGIAREYSELHGIGLEDMLAEIQSRLFDLGAAVATPVQTSSEEKRQYTEFESVFTRQIESWIDELDSQLPPLKNFVIPSGGLCSTHLNLSRTVCRRAERSVVPLVLADQVDAEVGRFLNRLSDFLFVAGRTAAAQEGKAEILWTKAKATKMKDCSQPLD